MLSTARAVCCVGKILDAGDGSMTVPLISGDKKVTRYSGGEVGTEVWAVMTSDEMAATIAGSPKYELTPLRQVCDRLGETDAHLLGRANAMASFHRNHQFCGRCGSPTQSHRVGQAAKCTECGFSVYPRLDPAIIAMVVGPGAYSSEWCLLGRKKAWYVMHCSLAHHTHTCEPSLSNAAAATTTTVASGPQPSIPSSQADGALQLFGRFCRDGRDPLSNSGARDSR